MTQDPVSLAVKAEAVTEATSEPFSPIQHDQDALAHGASLHGENAARRQAITELLFFASVGDVNRCQRICRTWRIQACAPRALSQLCCHRCPAAVAQNAVLASCSLIWQPCTVPVCCESPTACCACLPLPPQPAEPSCCDYDRRTPL
jgi:hypothetical protein